MAEATENHIHPGEFLADNEFTLRERTRDTGVHLGSTPERSHERRVVSHLEEIEREDRLHDSGVVAQPRKVHSARRVSYTGTDACLGVKVREIKAATAAKKTDRVAAAVLLQSWLYGRRQDRQ